MLKLLFNEGGLVPLSFFFMKGVCCVKIVHFLKRSGIVVMLVMILVVSLSVLVYAEDSSSSGLVTQSDGKSYDGLPAFPTQTTDANGNNTGWHAKFYDYVLFFNSDTGTYYLCCVPNVDVEYAYLYGDGQYLFDNYIEGSYYYKSNWTGDVTSYIENTGVYFTVYYASLNDVSWNTYGVHDVQFNSADGLKIGFCYPDTLIQSTFDIYTDDTLTSVFTKSATDPLIAGLSSTTLAQLTMAEIRGLVPLVIGFLTLAVALWKGWTMLRRVSAGA